MPIPVAKASPLVNPYEADTTNVKGVGMGIGHRLMILSVSISIIFSAQIWAQSAVPPPVEQTTADCTRPVYASDHLVCGDPALLLLDTRLAALLTQKGRAPSAVFYEDDVLWFKRRSRCAFEVEHRSCLTEAYTNRISDIEAISSVDILFKAAKCRNIQTARRAWLGEARSGQIVIKDKSNQLIGVASKRTDGSLWKPTMMFTQSAESYNFESYDGRRFLCKLS